MRNLIVLILIFISNISYSQWVLKDVDNKVDKPYRIAYSPSIESIVSLKLENCDGEIALYITGGYYCEDSIQLDIVLFIDSEIKSYSVIAEKSMDSESLFILDDILSKCNKEFLNDFKNCSQFIVRVIEPYCKDDLYVFNMSGSSEAIRFISEH